MAAASPGGTVSPDDPSTTSSGIPDSALATTGSPALIASMSTTGMPSRLPPLVGTLGATSTSLVPIRVGDLGAGPAAEELDPVGQARGGDLALERRPVRSLPDEPAAERDAIGGSGGGRPRRDGSGP